MPQNPQDADSNTNRPPLPFQIRTRRNPETYVDSLGEPDDRTYVQRSQQESSNPQASR